IEVRTESGICPGMAKTQQGETWIVGARTPDGPGVCSNAFNAIYPMALAMRLTDKMDWEKQDWFEITCPHGKVTYRIERAREGEEG
ncbi:MAG: hypothetical protein AB8I80_13595, partial [Anaerolineae bacterium]